MDPDVDPDLGLVRDLASGSREERELALTRLFERHQARVVTVAYRVLGSWAAAEDVAQEVFLHLARGVRGFRGDASFRSWVYRITVNRAIDFHRREARRPTVRFPDQPGAQDTLLPSDDEGGPTDPLEPLKEGEDAAAVQRAIMSLSPKLRAVAVLRYVEGLSYEELAEVLDCSMGTVKSRLNRAHGSLTRALGARFGDGAP